MIQIRQRRDGGDVCFRRLDDDRQPEAEFAEPDSHGISVDAKDAVNQDVSSELMQRASVTSACVDVGQSFEGVDKERT